MTTFIPQYKRDQNNVDHAYGYIVKSYPEEGGGFYFLERHVQYTNKKTKKEHDEVIQVYHLGKPFVQPWVKYPVTQLADMGLLLGNNNDLLEQAAATVSKNPEITVELMEHVSKEYQVYITAKIADINYVFSPETTFKSDKEFKYGEV